VRHTEKEGEIDTEIHSEERQTERETESEIERESESARERERDCMAHFLVNAEVFDLLKGDSLVPITSFFRVSVT